MKLAAVIAMSRTGHTAFSSWLAWNFMRIYNAPAQLHHDVMANGVGRKVTPFPRNCPGVGGIVACYESLDLDGLPDTEVDDYPRKIVLVRLGRNAVASQIAMHKRDGIPYPVDQTRPHALHSHERMLRWSGATQSWLDGWKQHARFALDFIDHQEWVPVLFDRWVEDHDYRLRLGQILKIPLEDAEDMPSDLMPSYGKGSSFTGGDVLQRQADMRSDPEFIRVHDCDDEIHDLDLQLSRANWERR